MNADTLPKIRYRKFGYIEFNVTNIERSTKYYVDLVSLELARTGGQGEVYFRCTEDPHAVVLYPAKEAGFKRAGWMLEDESQFANIYRRLDAFGVPYEDVSKEECQARGIGRAVRLVEPNTEAVQELYVNPRDYVPTPWKPKLADIQRLGHVAWLTPKVDEGVAFFRDVLNFAESDTVGEFVTFLRCWPNPYHHGLGVAKAPRLGFHHLNFMVKEIDDVGRGLHRMNAAKVPIVNGPGRHLASDSVFLYYLDPDGLTLEYSYGMEEFPETGARPPRKLPPVNDLWNGPVDPRFAKSGNVEKYVVATGQRVG